METLRARLEEHADLKDETELHLIPEETRWLLRCVNLSQALAIERDAALARLAEIESEGSMFIPGADAPSDLPVLAELDRVKKAKVEAERATMSARYIAERCDALEARVRRVEERMNDLLLQVEKLQKARSRDRGIEQPRRAKKRSCS